jgi:hypothetical protein
MTDELIMCADAGARIPLAMIFSFIGFMFLVRYLIKRSTSRGEDCNLKVIGILFVLMLLILVCAAYYVDFSCGRYYPPL